MKHPVRGVLEWAGVSAPDERSTWKRYNKIGTLLTTGTHLFAALINFLIWQSRVKREIALSVAVVASAGVANATPPTPSRRPLSFPRFIRRVYVLLALSSPVHIKTRQIILFYYSACCLFLGPLTPFRFCPCWAVWKLCVLNCPRR